MLIRSLLRPLPSGSRAWALAGELAVRSLTAAPRGSERVLCERSKGRRRITAIAFLFMLECVVNVSEGRSASAIDALADAVGPALLDVHRDADHNRSVFTVGGGSHATLTAVRRLAMMLASTL